MVIKTDVKIKTSEHIGVISLFEKEFVGAGKVDKRVYLCRQDVYKNLIYYNNPAEIEI
jgi:uncharacterized protein (UPF0332 family)